MLFLLAQAFAPGDCILTGLCGVRSVQAGPPSGLMFLALALLLAGGIGLRQARRSR